MTTAPSRRAGLIIEANPTTHPPLTELIENLGFRAVQAPSASNALQKFRYEPPAFVLLDFALYAA